MLDASATGTVGGVTLMALTANRHFLLNAASSTLKAIGISFVGGRQVVARKLGCNCCRICRLRHFLCPCLFILCVLRVLLLAWLMCGLRAFACVEQRKSVWVVRG